MVALGVDFGGVLVNRQHRHINAFGKDFLSIPALPGAFSSLARLRREIFGPNIFVVSRCTEEREPEILRWLSGHNFYRHTDISPKNIRFCRERADKAPIAAHLGLTHFVDDRWTVLRHMIGIVNNMYIFDPQPEEVRSYQQDYTRLPNSLPQVHVVRMWSEVVRSILA